MSAARVTVLGRKAVEQLRREVRAAPDQLQARRLGADVAALLPPATGPRVAILTPRSWASHVQWEAVIGHALRLRGADVTFLTCGGGLEICDRVNTYEGPPVPCRTCVGYTVPTLEAHGHRVRELSDHWGDGDWPELDAIPAADLFDVEADGLPLGRLVEVPVKWFLLGTGVDADPLAAITIRRFLRAARRVAAAIDTTFDEVRPDVLFHLNGLFFFEAIATAVAERRGIEVVSYERGFIHGTLFLRRGLHASSYDIGPLWERYKDVPLTDEQVDRLEDFLRGRRRGQGMIVVYTDADRPPPPQRPPGGRLVTLFTNITWDSAVIGREVAFAGIKDWLAAAIDAFAARPEHRLVVRIHPAEIKLPGKRTREPVGDIIRARYDRLPPNVTLIAAEDPADSYALMDESDFGLVYTSTAGLEMVLNGTPVMTAARVHYRGKGFTTDVSSPEEFAARLDEMLADPAAFAPDLDAARRYAYTFFFRALVSSGFVTEPVGGLARIAVEARALLPGASADFDRICAGILDGGDFSVDG